DMDIQYAIDVQLQRIAMEHQCDYAMAIVMDATNGDLLGISSYPWYDANKRGSSTAEQRKNHAVNHLFEPGSVFKLFSMASILELGEADTQTPFYCDGSYTFKAGNTDVTINCTSAHGSVDVTDMIAKSCNGAISHWAMQTEKETLYDMLYRLGFTRGWDISLPSRATAVLAPVQSWSARSAPTISFGQELLTSALHLVVAATAFTEEGQLLMPHLVLRRTDGQSQQVIYQRQRTVIEKLFSSETTAQIREGMHKATLAGGTGTRAFVDGLDVGIKTGTAQIWNAELKAYDERSFLASSLALVPVDNPRYIIYVGAANPKGSTIYGANIAAPAIQNIIQSLLSQGKLTRSSPD
ncbi:MAG: penicillin-binding protein 2, partial [Spirochaetia bacterium]|nr:penicillin-binding protein 2 [Spirochaetia bacterium]